MNKSHFIKLLIFSSLACLPIFFDSVVEADIGPTYVYSQGGFLKPSALKTNVSMNYENVVLTYGNEKYYGNEKTDSAIGIYLPVHVSAVFRMFNNGNQPEKIDVYFPSSDGFFVGSISAWGSLTNFKVNGKLLSEENITALHLILDEEAGEVPVEVYKWEETFEPQKETEIKIEYDTRSGGDYSVYYLTYVLGTGREWAGSIKEGHITFVFPYVLTDYSIVDHAPVLKENKIPYTVSENKVIVDFLDYEPDADTAIALGMYFPSRVEAIESLKKEPQTFDNVLKLAEWFRVLSQGPHRAFYTGKAADISKDYYNKSLDLASSEAELNKVLLSFVYGADSGETIDDLFQFFKYIPMICTEAGSDCEYAHVRNQYNFLSDASYDDLVLEVLTKYENKMTQYNPESAEIVRHLINNKNLGEATKQSKIRPTSIEVHPPHLTDEELAFYIRRILTIFLGFALTTVILVLLVIKIIKKNKKTDSIKKDNATPENAVAEPVRKEDIV